MNQPLCKPWRRWIAATLVGLAMAAHPANASPATANEASTVMGKVTAVGNHRYTVHPMGQSSAAARTIEVNAHSRFHFLAPVPRSVIRKGWQAHAIGNESPGKIEVRMLVLFPPAATGGVPPPEYGMKGIGTIAGLHPLSLLVRKGGRMRLELTADAAIVVAHPLPFRKLQVGETAMTFLTDDGSAARIVHVRGE